jgi:hypothetical protein
MRNDYADAMMAADRGAAKGVQVEGADPTKTIVPLVAALIPAATVPPLGVVAIAATVLNCLHWRQTSERRQCAAAHATDARPGPVDDG